MLPSICVAFIAVLRLGGSQRERAMESELEQMDARQRPERVFLTLFSSAQAI